MHMQGGGYPGLSHSSMHMQETHHRSLRGMIRDPMHPHRMTSLEPCHFRSVTENTVKSVDVACACRN